jgi:hypothetical protein
VATGGGGGGAGGGDVHCTSTAPAIASVEKTAVRGGFARPTRIPPTLPLALWRGNAAATHAGDAATRPAGAGNSARSAGDAARRTTRTGYSARSAGDAARRTTWTGYSARSARDRACRAFRSRDTARARDGRRTRRRGRRRTGATRAGEVITARRTARGEDDRRGEAGRSGSYCGGGRTSKKHRREFRQIDQHVGGCTSTEAARNFPRASKCYRTEK